MTDNSSQPIAAGWYADHTDPALQRWWDGTKWTEHTQRAYAPAAKLEAPAGTKWSTPWIWLVLLLPLLSLFSIFAVNMDGYFRALFTDPLRPDIAGAMAALFSPALLIVTLLGWVVYGLMVFFAFRDYKELEKRGVPKPFHWAFAFLSVVYPIGRGIVTNSRGAGGIAVTWIAIALILVQITVSLVWSVVLMGQMIAYIPSIPTTR